MYKTLFLEWHIQRRGRDIYWEDRDITELKILLLNIGFRYHPDHEYGDLAQDIGDTSRFDCQDRVPEINRVVVQAIDVNTTRILNVDRLYIVVPKTNWMFWRDAVLPSNVFYDEDEVEYDDNHEVYSYTVVKDASTWNIKLVRSTG